MLTLKTEPGYVRADRDGYDETIRMVKLIHTNTRTHTYTHVYMWVSSGVHLFFVVE